MLAPDDDRAGGVDLRLGELGIGLGGVAGDRPVVGVTAAADVGERGGGHAVERFPGPHGLVRLENWRHALDQGTIAGKNAAGATEIYRAIPSFWSEQYDLYIQGVGWPAPGSTRIRRPLPGTAALQFDMNGNHLVYAMGINVQHDLSMARRLIERQIPVDPAALADPSKPLAAMLKTK